MPGIDTNAFAELIEETKALVKQAGGSRGVLRLSPETAAALERTGAGPQAALERIGAGPEAALDAMAAKVSACERCLLAQTRTKTVFGSGNAQASVVFVGEAPGSDEDRQGLPFVGRAGQLLTRIIEGGMGMSRSDVYICNVLKCRPPDNRDPEPDEVAACHGYLIQQLDIIQPKVIIALGRPASQTLLNTSDGVNKLRGRWHFYHGIPLRVTFHPAYLLRKEQDKGKCWEDIKRVLALLAGEEKPQPPAQDPPS